MSTFNQIFERIEKKYILTEEQYKALRQYLDGIARVDAYGETQILNIYYDTPDFQLIRASLSGPVYKEKLRLRSYGVPTDESTAFLEIKKKYKGIVYKRRIDMPYWEALAYLDGKTVQKKMNRAVGSGLNETYTTSGTDRYPGTAAISGENSDMVHAGVQHQIRREIDYFFRRYEGLRPKMAISYDRIAMQGTLDPDFRVTFDRNIRWRTKDLDLRCGSIGEDILGPGQILMELKIQGAVDPALSREMSRLGIFQTTFSKYGEGYLALQRRLRERNRYVTERDKVIVSATEQVRGKIPAFGDVAATSSAPTAAGQITAFTNGTERKKPVPVIIPAYEPDERLLSLLRALTVDAPGPVILVDDGSGPRYQNIFAEAERMVRQTGGCLLTHPENRGKGSALKTAFTYVSGNMPEAVGVVTADSDGQHSRDAIRSVAEALRRQPDHLILGGRNFDGGNVPWKSRVGNKLTALVLRYVSDLRVKDTQTGLRGIPASFLPELVDVKGSRFEYEMRMLLAASGTVPVTEIPVPTIYDSKEHHQTHFKPVRDSLLIYGILGGQFLKYAFSSLSSSVLDLALFTVFCSLFLSLGQAAYLLQATICARAVSSLYNFFLNERLVFRSREETPLAAAKYFLLVIIQMSCSALLVTGLAGLVPGMSAAVIKLLVDGSLFFVSYAVQQRFVFRTSTEKYLIV